MQDNARLAKLILGQIEGTGGTSHDTEITLLLEQCLQDYRSRIDLCDRLAEGARNTNSFTARDIAEVITQSLADQIRDLKSDIRKYENDLLPTRLIMGSLIGVFIGTFTAMAYDKVDLLTALGVAFAMAIGFFTTYTFRKHTLKTISLLNVRRENYQSFSDLLHGRK